MTDDERDEIRRFRANMFLIGVACACAAGYLAGVLATSVGLPPIVVGPVLMLTLAAMFYRRTPRE